jgi:signal transduction histidine kinase
VTPGDSFPKVSKTRSVVRVALTRFLLLSFGTLVVVGAGTLVVSRDIAENEAIRDAQVDGEEMADAIGTHVVRAKSHPGPETAGRLDRRLSGMSNGSVQPIALWDSKGRLLWADSHFEAGARYEFPPRLQEVARQGGSLVMDRDDPGPSPEIGPAAGQELAVYVGSRSADGERFMYEAHAPFPSDEEAGVILRELLPVTLGALLLLQLANVPLALSLARRVDRSTDHRSMILSRSLLSWHDERRRLAQDLHDGVIQDLSAMSYALPAVLAQLPDEPKADPARSIGERMTEALIQDLRALRSVLIDLVPADLDGNGLQQALEALGQRSADRGLHVEVSVEPDLGVGSAVAGLVYRVAREGLRNAEKHAEARTASVHVAREGDCVEILVDDDGQGIKTPEASDGHVGLRLLEELVADVGGDLSLTNVPGRGARLRGVIPAVLPELGDEAQ